MYQLIFSRVSLQRNVNTKRVKRERARERERGARQSFNKYSHTVTSDFVKNKGCLLSSERGQKRRKERIKVEDTGEGEKVAAKRTKCKDLYLHKLASRVKWAETIVTIDLTVAIVKCNEFRM